MLDEESCTIPQVSIEEMLMEQQVRDQIHSETCFLFKTTLKTEDQDRLFLENRLALQFSKL